ncbi:hypothetical protein [Arsenophonus endosymbiont of Bemisia tabaci]|uniref:hypothetical protein n=1 Tax=Arsenophonus endosymbiont of Bemisia tabaci TaxID=536059 RepID=UPI0015F462BC|nr:hypothetical protein [Arsenophonus endosymbiont of Bemisia tabaci]
MNINRHKLNAKKERSDATQIFCSHSQYGVIKIKLSYTAGFNSQFDNMFRIEIKWISRE